VRISAPLGEISCEKVYLKTCTETEISNSMWSANINIEKIRLDPFWNFRNMPSDIKNIFFSAAGGAHTNNK
jgi:hypothetical protein